MTIKLVVPLDPKENIIRCINIITREGDPKIGLTCDLQLLRRNSKGEVNGEIKCRRCGGIMEIKNNKLILLERNIQCRDKE